MAKKNKGTSSAKRKTYSMSKRAEFEKDNEKMVEVCNLFPDWELADVHRILFAVLRSIEVALEREGRKPDKYVEHRVTKVEHDLGPDFVYCRRCKYARIDGEDAMGKWMKCLHPDMHGMLCAYSDGCTHGIKRKEYR